MNIVYAPNLVSPLGNETFNFGQVNISWNVIDPPTSVETIELTDIHYEIEYADEFKEENTVWHTITKRVPGTSDSFTWTVGRMIKTENARIRIRAKSETLNQFSEYSQSVENFTVNIHKISPPAIMAPISGKSYSDYVTIIIDNSQVINTYNQKTLYNLDYYSEKNGIEWTSILSHFSAGVNVVRWNIDSLPAGDDYQLRLTVHDDQKLQTAIVIVDNIKVSNPGLFIIDTTPPQAVIELSDFTSFATNKLDHVINVYAEDASTDIKSLQLKETKISSLLTLGPITTTDSTETDTTTDPCDFSPIPSVSFTPKVPWTFKDESGQKKLEALLVDYAGNKSCTKEDEVFIPIYRGTITLTDVVVTIETVSKLTVANGQTSLSNIEVESAYVGRSDGALLRLSPSPKVAYTFNDEITSIVLFNELIFVATYNNDLDESNLYSYTYTQTPTLIETFTDQQSKITSMSTFNNVLYIGMSNGKLVQFDNSSFSTIHTFDNSIKVLNGDERYLYIGFYTSDNLYTFDGTNFYELTL